MSALQKLFNRLLKKDKLPEPKPLAVVSEDDVYWNMHWGTRYEDKPPVERMFEETKALAVLLLRDVLIVNTNWWEREWPDAAKKTFAIAVNCNDIFVWGAADAEMLSLPELQDLYDHWEKDKEWGPAVWCIKKRKQLPQRPVLEAIERAGIWDLRSLGLGENYYDVRLLRSNDD